jgi:hypothetical protein
MDHFDGQAISSMLNDHEYIVKADCDSNPPRYLVHQRIAFSWSDQWLREDQISRPLLEQYRDAHPFHDSRIREQFKDNPPVAILEPVMFGGMQHYRVRFLDGTYGAIGPEFVLELSS